MTLLQSLSQLFLEPWKALLPRVRHDAHPMAQEAQKRKTRQSQKDLLRTLIVMVANFLLLLFPKSLATLGNAAFFGSICAIILPPSMPLTLYLFAATTLVLGMLLGWAWGAAAVAASLRARSQVLLKQTLQTTQASIAGKLPASAANPDQEYRRIIFEGRFLDARSTVVFGVLLATGCFFFGLMRAKAPKLALLSIFGSIVLDVLCSYSPLFPFAQYTLATNFLLPTACFLAIATVCTCLIFPRSLNAAACAALTDALLVSLIEFMDTFDEMLATKPRSDAWADLKSTITARRASIVAGLEGFLGFLPLLDLELSRGAVNATDLKALVPEIKAVGGRGLALAAVYDQLPQQSSGHKSTNTSDLSDERDEKAVRQASDGRLLDSYREKHDKRAADDHTDLQDLWPQLRESSRSVRRSAAEVLQGTSAYFVGMNASRWYGRAPDNHDQEHQRARIEQFEQALKSYRDIERLACVEPFRQFFDLTSGKMNKPLAPAGLFYALYQQHTMLSYLDALLAFAKKAHTLQAKRTHTRFWLPTGLRNLGNAISGHQRLSVLGDSSDPDSVEAIDQDTADSHLVDPDLDPEARPPRNALQKVFTKMHALFSTQKDELIFATKYAVISVLLWLPQVFKSSAFFIYTEKGLWALIMAQTGMTVYGGDQIFSSFLRIGGTVVGLLWGMVIWYIGSGNGQGNRAGIAVAFTFLVIPIIVLRLFSQPQYMQAVALVGATTVLIVGYGWVDTHLRTLGNPGYGIDLAWRRALLVLIGMAAATIMMLLPYRSSRHVVRVTHSTVIRELGRIYTRLVSTWIEEEALENKSAAEKIKHDQPEGNASTSRSRDLLRSRTDEMRSKVLALYSKLQQLRQASAGALFDISLRGDFPAEEYDRLYRLEQTILESLAQGGFSLLSLSPEWRRKLVRRTAFLNQRLLADTTSVFYLSFMALRSGQSLPQRTPGPLLDRLLYHDKLKRREEDGSEHLEHEGAALVTDLTFDTLKTESFAQYASAVLSLAHILGSLDQLELVIKEIVGEVRESYYARLPTQEV